jgi:hypothetical protein
MRVRRSRRIVFVGIGLVLMVGLAVSASGSPPSDPTDEQVAERQAAVDAHYEQMYQYGLANPAPQQPDDSADTVGPPAPLLEKSEIVADSEYPVARYSFVNRFSTPYGDHNILVYAGSLSEEAAQGVLLVWDEDTQAQTVETTEFLAPKANGALTIVDAEGMLLTLTSSDGAKYQFDVAARKWVLG